MTEKDEIVTILGLQLYDVLNILGVQMEEKNTTSEEIVIRAFNNHTKKNNILTVSLQEE